MVSGRTVSGCDAMPDQLIALEYKGKAYECAAVNSKGRGEDEFDRFWCLYMSRGLKHKSDRVDVDTHT